MKKYILFSNYTYGNSLPAYRLKRLSNAGPNQRSASTIRMFGTEFASHYTGQWITEGAYLQMKAVPNPLRDKDVGEALRNFPWLGHDT